MTLEEVYDRAERKHGMQLTEWSLGPFFRFSARRTKPFSSEQEKDKDMGYCAGYVLPMTRVVHIDALEVARAARDDATNSLALGLSVTLGAAFLCRARSRGSRTARILAIEDDAYTHARLVKYYETLGFRVVREATMADMLVWGGRGAIMEASVDTVLARWARFFRRRER